MSALGMMIEHGRATVVPYPVIIDLIGCSVRPKETKDVNARIRKMRRGGDMLGAETFLWHEVLLFVVY